MSLAELFRRNYQHRLNPVGAVSSAADDGAMTVVCSSAARTLANIFRDGG
jgi:hypothetical protein